MMYQSSQNRTEVNDEEAANVPLLGQETPNTGVDENGVVTSATGFIPGGPVLTAFPGADFTVDGYVVVTALCFVLS